MAGLRFQVLTLPNAPWNELAGRFRRLEELGFDVAAIADHFVDWTNPPSPWLEAWTLLAAAARETSRIRLCTCVSQIPLRDPAMFARQGPSPWTTSPRDASTWGWAWACRSTPPTT